jgi:hypothetical protein
MGYAVSMNPCPSFGCHKHPVRRATKAFVQMASPF